MTDEELRQFFREKIVPAAEVLRKRGVHFFPLSLDGAATSYWKERPRGERYVFQIEDDLEKELSALWKDVPELKAMAGDFATFARELAERREESADVSSFIYAMF